MDKRPPYYFDNNATTRIAPEVLEVVIPLLSEGWGNPSSVYYFGNHLTRVMDQARVQLGRLLQADPRDLVFTSGGTESNNTAIHSALALHPDKRHVVTTAVEHAAVLNCCRFWERQGCEVTRVPVDAAGNLDLAALRTAMRPDTALVSVMMANNETGMMFPIAEIASWCRERGVLCHTDAVQVPGKLELDVQGLGVDYLSLSAHKLHAPKGIGLLYVRNKTRFQPLLMGGHQERGRRAGTENVAAMAGFGRAAELALHHLEEENTRVRALRDRLESDVLEHIPGTRRNGAAEPRLPNTTNLVFEGIESEAMLLQFDQFGICASSGSACTTGSLEPSHVLAAMGVKPSDARSSIRFSLSVDNTSADVDYLLEHLPRIVAKLRSLSPEWRR